MLFRCSDCPTTYCFDCWPAGLEQIQPSDEYLGALLTRGFDPVRNAKLFLCSECADEKEQERRKAEERVRQVADAARERERQRREVQEKVRAREARKPDSTGRRSRP